MNDEQQTQPEPIEAEAPQSVLMPIAAVRLALAMISGEQIAHAMVDRTRTLAEVLRATIEQDESLPSGFDEFANLAQRVMRAGRKACENVGAGKVEIRMNEDQGVTYLVLSVADDLTAALMKAVSEHDAAGELERTAEGEDAAAKVTEALAGGDPGADPA